MQGTVRPGAVLLAATTCGTLPPTTFKQTFEFSPLAGPFAMTIGHKSEHEPALYKPYVTTYAEELSAPAVSSFTLNLIPWWGYGIMGAFSSSRSQFRSSSCSPPCLIWCAALDTFRLSDWLAS